MKKVFYILIAFICVLTLSMSIQTQTVSADTGSDIIDNIDLSEEEQAVVDALELQIEQIKAIVTAIIASFLGTGTVALIVKIVLDKTVAELKKKVAQAEAEGKVSKETADALRKGSDIFVKEVTNQVNRLEQTVTKLLDKYDATDKSVNELLDEYKARDEEIKTLLETMNEEQE